MNWAAISTVTVLLFLFGMSLQTSWQLETLLNQFGSQLEVSVYLETNARVETIKPLVAQMSEVADIQTITKEQAWDKLVNELGITDIAAATQQLGENPLVDELKVKALNSEAVPTLATELVKIRGVDNVQYVDEAVRNISRLHQGLNWVSLTFAIILTVTAIAVTTTTIRLIVTARRKEIEVMQVGATCTWIYLPFILQGITFGVLGGVIAWGLISLIQQFISKLIAQQAEFIQFLTHGFKLSLAQTILLPLVLLSFGSIVGLIGSLLAVRRFAKV
ncbi:Cell division protein FtsX [Richelia intracellularis]|nr:Cell division protein FtsX [Richelia intracellularis]